MLPPFSWYGGKRHIGQDVWSRFGDVEVYAEPFSGSLAVLLYREKPVNKEIVCDLDGCICNFWRAVTYDPETVAQWAEYPNIHHDLIARHIYLVKWVRNQSQQLTSDPTYYDAKVAGWWLWGISRWIGSLWCGRQPPAEQRPMLRPGGMAYKTSAEILVILRRIQTRMKRTSVLNRSWESAVTPAALDRYPAAVFLDPPYITEGRGDLYGSDLDQTSNIVARDSWKWACENGDKYRIAYCAHEGDVKIPHGWSYQVEDFRGVRDAERRAARKDIILYSPACEHSTLFEFGEESSVQTMKREDPVPIGELPILERPLVKNQKVGSTSKPRRTKTVPTRRGAPQAPKIERSPIQVSPKPAHQTASPVPHGTISADPSPTTPQSSTELTEALVKPPSPTSVLARFTNSPDPVSDATTWTPEAPPQLDGVTELEIDTETNGLKWYEGDRPIGISIRRPDGKTWYLPWGHAGGNLDEAVVKRWAQRELRDKTLTGANIKFDVHMMRTWGIDLEEQNCRVSDVMHYAALLDDYRREFSLDKLASDFLNERKSGEDLDKTRMAEYHAGFVADYACRDVTLTGKLRALMWAELTRQDLHRVRELEENVIYPVCEMERNSAPIDRDLLKKWVTTSEHELHELLIDISINVGFQVNPDKAGDMLRVFKHFDLPITFTDKGAPSFTDDILKHIDHPIIQKTRRAGKLASLRSKFLVSYDNVLTHESMLRFELHQLRGDKYGTNRGRFSASNKNIQQVMSKGNQRIAFGVRRR